MILKNLQYGVSVADITDRARFFLQRQDSCGYSYKNIYFYKGELPNETGDGDCVFVLADEGSSGLYELCDRMYVVVDNSYGMSEYVKNILRGNSRIDGVIFRDITDNGITGQYIVKHIIKDDYLMKLFRAGCVYQIADDMIDREYKIAIGYEGISDFKNLSSGFLRVLSSVVQRITGEGARTVEKAIARAKEGEIFEYSILE